MGKKITEAVLLSMCLIWLAGCAGENEDGAVSPQSTEDVVKGTIITSYIQQSGSPASVWKGWGAALLYEDTGLVLESFSTDGQNGEDLKLRLSSGTVPDIIGFSDREQAQLYIDAGLLLPLNEYREQLPSLFEGEAYQAALEWSVAAGGGEDLLLAPLSVGKVGEREYHSMPMLLKSAWERAGSPGVSSLEDYIDVIKQLKKAKPTSDVGESMYGICLWQGDGKMPGHAASLAYMYGIDMQIVSPLMEVNMATGGIRSILEEDSFFKRAVHFYYEANRQGLLDPDSPNQTAGNVERKMNSGRVLFAVDLEMAGMDNSLQGAEDSAYMPLPAGDMVLYLEPDHVVGTGECLAVNKNSERAEDAVRLLDWLYREETEVCLYNGPEGVLWEYGEGQVPYVTEEGAEILEKGALELPGLQGSLQEGIRPFGVLGRTPASLTEQGYAFSSRYWQREEAQGDSREDTQKDGGDSREDAQEDRGSSREDTQADSGGSQRDVQEDSGDSREDTQADSGRIREDWDTVRASTAVYMTDTLPPELSGISDEIEKLVYRSFWNMVYAEDEAEFEEIWQSLAASAQKAGMDRLAGFYEEAWERALERAAGLEEGSLP